MIRRFLSSAATAVELPPSPTALPVSGSWTVEESFGYCERIARGSAENFPVASRFVPAALRPYVWAIYSFARAADNFADEPQFEGHRREALDHWEEALERCYHGEADHPIFIALRETVEKRDIPISPLQSLLTAFRMDLHVKRHPTFASLKNYCAHCAEPIGRLLLYIFDYRETSLLRFADDLSTGLQLTKILQDVASDARAGRIYLPLEDLSHFGVTEADLATGQGFAPGSRGGVTRDFRDLMRFQVARARSYFERGRPITDRVGRDLGFELNLVFHGGMTILDKIEAVDYDVYQRRPVLEAADKVLMLARSAARRWPQPSSR